ncbi:hypothetical protein ABZ896_18730 [Streptomyces sp. NPDC047072]|uniref:hypothetical protein n=1 Tax=Streptomyces sp. NPDC047072 TaxID=3154809 RepID=UPI0033D2308C
MLTLDSFRSREDLPSLLLAGASVTVALVLTPGTAMFTVLVLFVGLLLVLDGREAPLVGGWPHAPLAVAVTVAVHLAFCRRTILSVGAGTAVYVVLLNAF